MHWRIAFACVREGVACSTRPSAGPRHRNIVLFLVARMVLLRRPVAVFAFIGIYAASEFGWGQEVAIYGLLIIVTAGGQRRGRRPVDDAVGSKRTIQISLVIFDLPGRQLSAPAGARIWYLIS